MKWTYSIILLLALTTCTKFGKNISISGRVYNPVTNKGIKGISIRMFKSKNDPGEILGNSSGVKFVAEATTDENGHYTIEHLGGTKDYFIQVNPLDYYPIGWSDTKVHDNKLVKKGKAIVADFQLVPYGNFTINLKNTSCSGQTDNIKIFLDGSEIGWDNVQIGQIIEQNGCIDIQGDFNKYPSGKRYYHWTVTKNGSSTIIYDTVSVIPNQNTTLQINY